MRTILLLSLQHLLLAALIIIFPATASPEQPDLDYNGLANFVNDFYTAAEAKDYKQLAWLTLTDSFDCVTPENMTFYNKIVENTISIFDIQYPIVFIEYQLITVDELISGIRQLKLQGAFWPQNPVVRIAIHYLDSGKEQEAGLFVAKEDDVWKWVRVCKVKYK